MKKIFTLILCAMTMLVAQAQVTIDELTVVGETTFVMQQEPSGGWGSTMYEVHVPGAAELLGVEKSYMQENFTSMFYAQTGSWGSLVNDGNVDVPAGFYYQITLVIDDNGDDKPMCVNTYDWSASIFFFHKGAYDAENDVVQIGCGQNPTRSERVGKHDVDNYIVNGDKAYIIHFKVNIEAPDQRGIEELTSVGSTEWIVEKRNPAKGWDDLDSLQLNMDEILAQFSAVADREVDASELKLMAINEYDGITDMYTADDYETTHGFWFTAATGKTQVYGWGTQSYFINFEYTEGKLYVGNMPGAFAGGEEMYTAFYLVLDDTYYHEIGFTMTLAAPDFTLDDCEMEELNMEVQVVPSSEEWLVRTIDVTNLEEMMGAADLKFYGVTAEGEITTDYSVSETAQGGGGFWMSPLDENGWAHAAGYTGQGAFAIWYTGAGEMVFFNQPGLPQPGDKVKATFYMANLWEGKALKINMTVRYVEVIKEVSPVGIENIELAGRDEAGDGYSEVELDLTLCAETMGVDVETIKENAVLAVINPDGDLTSEGMDNNNMFTFNADGELVEKYAENEVFRIGLVDGMISALIISEENLGNSYNATIYLVYDYEDEIEDEEGEVQTVTGQLVYAYNVTVKGTAPDAIAAVHPVAVGTRTYDLAGRELVQPFKGICIKGGKKLLVK